jgi:hypothetical protein
MQCSCPLMSVLCASGNSRIGATTIVVIFDTEIPAPPSTHGYSAHPRISGAVRGVTLTTTRRAGGDQPPAPRRTAPALRR